MQKRDHEDHGKHKGHEPDVTTQDVGDALPLPGDDESGPTSPPPPPPGK